MLSTETCAPKNPEAAPENRVGDFFSVSFSCAGQNQPQALEPHQAFSTIDTTTVSGVVYWLSKDPIGISGGLNLYEAFGNNPVNFIDPWGLEWSVEATQQRSSMVHQHGAYESVTWTGHFADIDDGGRTNATETAELNKWTKSVTFTYGQDGGKILALIEHIRDIIAQRNAEKKAMQKAKEIIDKLNDFDRSSDKCTGGKK